MKKNKAHTIQVSTVKAFRVNNGSIYIKPSAIQRFSLNPKA